jgi:hypothetical protein
MINKIAEKKKKKNSTFLKLPRTEIKQHVGLNPEQKISNLNRHLITQ